MKFVNLIALSLSLLVVACSAKTESKTEAKSEPMPIKSSVEFNGDSAYCKVKAQVDFGSRVPGTTAHEECAKYLVNELKHYGADSVIEQKTIVTAFNGDKLPINNILGQINKNATTRILLLAHWDSRPWGDEDADESMRTKPIPGANDGASGVGVLLEVARCLNIEKPAIGVDILFVDAEDYGDTKGDSENSWCLGTQYWIKYMPYTPQTMPKYGILLDMVGGKDAKFNRERISMALAQSIVDRVWSVASNSGYGNIFVNELGGPIVDDHYYVNQAGIPCIDIIECAHSQTGSFNPTWHTHADDMSNISGTSLKAVGQTLLNVIYQEK